MIAIIPTGILILALIVSTPSLACESRFIRALMKVEYKLKPDIKMTTALLELIDSAQQSLMEILKRYEGLSQPTSLLSSANSEGGEQLTPFPIRYVHLRDDPAYKDLRRFWQFNFSTLIMANPNHTIHEALVRIERQVMGALESFHGSSDENIRQVRSQEFMATTDRSLKLLKQLKDTTDQLLSITQHSENLTEKDSTSTFVRTYLKDFYFGSTKEMNRLREDVRINLAMIQSIQTTIDNNLSLVSP